MKILELNLGLGINKIVASKVDNNHSEQGTKRSIAKKALEMIKEKWSGRSDYMEMFNRDYDVMLKKFMSQIYDCYSENPTLEYVFVEPVAKRKINKIKLNTRNVGGSVTEVEATLYKTKVEAFKKYNLYAHKKANGVWCLTEASTGMMVIDSLNTKKGLEERLEQYAHITEAMDKKIVELQKQFGNTNPHLVDDSEISFKTEEEKEAENIERLERRKRILLRREVKNLSSGTIISIAREAGMVTNRATWLEADAIVDEWIDFIDESKDSSEHWQESWKKFAAKKDEELENWINEDDEEMEIENMEKISFNPQDTAIDTRNSKSAEMIVEEIGKNTKIIDYGCGTGRNIRYILEKNEAEEVVIDGTDIKEQLVKQHQKHNELRKKGCLIEESNKLPSDYYDVALNSHVLNVIESDEVKKIVIADIYDKLVEGGVAYIEVRTKSDVEGAKTKEPYGDGWKIKKGSGYTYQEAISKEKMKTLVSSVGFKIQEHIYNASRHIVKVAK